MDARERLRAYLEQRREMGESEFVLDGMSVEDALGAIDKLRTTQPARPKPARAATPATPQPPLSKPASPRVAAPAVQPVIHARVEQRVEEVKPAPSADAPRRSHESSPEIGKLTDFRQGLVVGSATGTLFEQNPFHGVRSLAELAKLIEDCTRCQLHKTAKCAVPGDGDPDADFMCVGRHPGPTRTKLAIRL